MKTLLIFLLLGVSGYLFYENFQNTREIRDLRSRLGINSEGGSSVTVERGVSSEDKTEGNSRSFSTSTFERMSGALEDLPFDQFFDSEKAFAKDELFAVTSKKTIPAEYYTDRFDKNSFGNPTTKSHPAVYIVRCLGRETRENYLFIVDRAFYDAAKMHQKFTNAEMSNFEFFLSEEKLERTIFSRRFRGKMVD